MVSVDNTTAIHRDDDSDGCASLGPGLLHYVLETSWIHQAPLVTLTIATFLLEVVPLELQRRVINDVVKHRHYPTVIAIGAAYAGSVLIQGATKLGLNVYRAWVGERAKRDLRQRISHSSDIAVAPASVASGTTVSML